MRTLASAAFLCMFVACASALAASSDEIQVYDDAINTPGETSVELHMNYVPSGLRTPAYSGEIPARHEFRLTPEFAYDLNQRWEAGFYLPAIRATGGDDIWKAPSCARNTLRITLSRASTGASTASLVSARSAPKKPAGTPSCAGLALRTSAP
ncbi:MAG: hypothetical protein HY066_03945 [Betaproteobacteria bacterium]|nr:hypothetical protein [Betaproteobacteria bacterium]